MTRKATVIGWPIKHSKSPVIHSYWLAEHGIDATYEKTAVAPQELEEWTQTAWDEGLTGFNATIPHKVSLMKLVEADIVATSIGAINTVFRGQNGWLGTNTDAAGWWSSLGLKNPPKNALIIGAGGAAKAIIYALMRQGTNLTITNRTKEKAAALGFKVIDWKGTSIDGRGFDLIVNSSACGMNNSNSLTLTNLDSGCVVSDLVYSPLKTEFLRSAADLGGVPIDGIGMLLHQAANSFEKWFGIMPAITNELKEHVLAS